MPFRPYWRRYRHRYYRKPRRWRFGTFVRRKRRRPWRRVRIPFIKKLKNIILRQWQPPAIRKCHIKGLSCLALINAKRLSFNATLYENSTVPEFQPGGGGFAVMKFTLQNLWEMHNLCLNWWTQSNENLPLVRYMGCTITCYRSDNIDYVIAYQNTPPFNSNKLTYPSCQPSMLLMRKNKIIVRSKKSKKYGKPYKRFFVKPPSLLQNKWYFQKDICTQTLLVLHTAALSLDHYYININSESNNITIKHLNTRLIENRNFGGDINKTEHYWIKMAGTLKMYLYRYSGTEHSNNTQNFLIQDLCPLTQSIIHREGLSYAKAKNLDHALTTQNYKKDLLTKYAGNMFHKHNYTPKFPIFQTTVSPETMFNNFTEQTKFSQIEQHTRGLVLADPIITQGRYNPNTDTGETTLMYLLPNNKPGTGWEPPDDETAILGGFPLWLNIYGFTDFQIRLQKYIGVMEQYMLCFKSKQTKPLYAHILVPIDTDFMKDQSPYLTALSEPDSKKWYPQLQYQTSTINAITTTGPGIAKFGDIKSEEIKIKYDFSFKWGGDPAKMVTVDNPSEQITYPIPRNEHEMPSLQSPAQNYETVVYTFDQRNWQLTKAALERIQKDYETEKDLLSITEPATREVPVLQTLQKLYNETQTEEEKQEALLLQLERNKQQQLQLRQRILTAILKMQNLE